MAAHHLQRVRVPGISGLALFLSLCLSTCSHDAPRQNPLDPELTPPVELEATLDATTGAVALTWSRYEGDEDFAAYKVLRNISESTRVETLAVYTHPDSTTAVDTSLAPITSYAYRVAVVNRAGHAALSQPATVTGFNLGSVTLSPPLVAPERGAVVLQWTAYTGPGFKGYEVLRHRVGSDVDTVLFASPGRLDTLASDTTARHGEAYAYTVRSRAAGQDLASNSREAILELPTVTMAAPLFESASASASGTWSRYTGPRFLHYELQRRTSELSYVTLETRTDVADTAFADGELRGDTEYVYRVVVVTDRGEEIGSNEAGGGLHRQVDSWTFSRATRIPAIRLYRQPNGRVDALYSIGPGGHIFNGTLAPGGVIERMQTLVQNPYNWPSAGYNLATTIDGEGHRTLLYLLWVGAALSTYSADGQVLLHTTEIQMELPEIALSSARIGGEVALRGGVFGDLKIWSSGQRVSTDDLDSLPPEAPYFGDIGIWSFERVSWAADRLFFSVGVSTFSGHAIGRDSSWVDLVLGMSYHGTKGVRIGKLSGASLSYAFNWADRQVDLVWSYSPAAESGLLPMEMQASADLVGLDAVPSAVEFGSVGRDAWITVRSPAALLGGVDQPIFCTAAQLHGSTLVTSEDSLYTVSPEGAASGAIPLPWRVSEMRVWEGRRLPQVGVCIPDENIILVGDVPDGVIDDLPSYLTRRIGPGTGAPASFLVSPLSFDVGPNGRYYVLDAGNARIVVFDSNRQYVTEFGGWGSGPGQFNFGRGGNPGSTHPGFRGSIAVDADGAIYVADEENRRIQKFAP